MDLSVTFAKMLMKKLALLANDKAAVAAALKKFQAEKIKGRKYTYLVLGDKDKVDMDFLKTLGKVEVFTIDEIFGEKERRKVVN